MTKPCKQAGRLRVGCAGWSLSRESAPSFPAEGSHLERYAALFNTVEINTSFYRPHRAQTYARWAACVPDEFLFSVKLPRSISHDARLVDIDAPLRQFALEAGALGPKLGCVLVQLPPKLAFDAAIAGDFFRRLQDSFGCMIACEARNASWFGDEATALLAERGITRVIADPPKGQEGAHVATTAAFYARLHGSPRVYYSSYASDYLAQVARYAMGQVGEGRDVWVVFDNTASGAAILNALELLSLAQAASLPA
jgi:uncharacterized protein YecE (DUF72 family)